MPSAQHPQAKFDPLPPDLDLPGLVDRTSNFRWVQRVSRTQIRSLGQHEFEKLVAIHVIAGGKPLVIDGWDSVLPRWLFNAGWLEKSYDKKQENVRDISNATDIPMTTGHYLRSMKQLTNQWTPSTFRDERRQRLYLKDIDCPDEWRDALQKVIHPNLFYLNENVTTAGGQSEGSEDFFRNEATAAPAGDLMSSLPEAMRAQNLMCYIGHEGTYTPAHREMCASLGQNIMVEASGEENGERPGSSVWFMTESKDREVVREYFLSVLGHDIEIEKHFAQVNAWKKAPFDVYIVEQRPGDFVIIPPLAAHQVWNRGTRTMKVAWNRTTAETLDLALHEALPKARLVCRDEQYKNKAIIYFTLQKYHRELQEMEEKAEMTQMSFMGLGQDVIRNSPRAKQLSGDFKKLFGLFTQVLVDEIFAFKEKDVELIPFDSCVTCSYCRSNIFNRFLTCRHCVRTLVGGDEDAYDICMECYAMGRSCACLSGLQWCEQWSWSELVDNYETWRATVIMNDGFVDVEHSPQPLEIARQRAGKKSVAQICQEALRRRPWRDITKPEREKTPSESEPDGEGKSAKKPKRKKKKGDLTRCHVCCHRDYTYKVHKCTNPDCSEAYCYGVLYRAFDMMPQKVLEDENWKCPKCLGICNCGACRRSGITKPYTPKNTSLGHDTRRIADDRSVEILVDFRVHNLGWLKAAGEESRSKNSRRMQRLRQQAEDAKAEDLPDLATQVEADQNMQNDMMSVDHMNSAVPEGPLVSNGYGDQSHILGNGETLEAALPHNGSEVRNVAGEIAPTDPADVLVNELLGAELGDLSAYPDPSDFARQRIGLGYYEQDDTPDKILFDPYSAPTTQFLEEDEPDISEYVRRSIKAAKRKARRQIEDPDFVIGKSSNKKRRLTVQPSDPLDSMDPALFNEEGQSAPTAPTTTDEQSVPMDATEAVNTTQIDQVFPQQKRILPRYDANEPELRHAKPRASYIEVDDLEVDFEEEEAPEPRKKRDVPGAIESIEIEANNLDLASQAVTSLLGQPRSNDADEKLTHRKRGRPSKRASVAASPSLRSAIARKRGRRRGRSRRSTLSTAQVGFDDADLDSDHLENQGWGEVVEDAPNENQKRRRGRPRRSGVTTIAAATLDMASDADSDHELQVQDDDEEKPQPRKRGRPRRSEVAAEPTTTRKSSPMNSQFMSMRDRMAMRGKSFKIGKRRPRDSAVSAREPSQEGDGEGEEALSPSREELVERQEHEGWNDDNKSGKEGSLVVALTPRQSSLMASESPQEERRSQGETIVSLGDAVPEMEEAQYWSDSADSSGDEDIPSTKPIAPRTIDMSEASMRGKKAVAFRGGGRGRGRPPSRGGGRGRGRPRAW